MSEENRAPWQVITETGNLYEETEELEPEQELSPIEQQAMEKGWVPEEQWTGNPEDWRSAKEFMDRSSFYQRINNQNRIIEELRQDNIAVQEHLRKLRETQNKDYTSRLEQQKIEALESGDYNRVAEIDRNIREVETQNTEPEPQETNPEQDPVFQEWLSDNPWYSSDPELRVDADAFGISYRQNNPNASAHEVFDYVTNKIKKTNPDKFNPQGAAQSRAANNASNPTASAPSGSKKTYRDLNEDQLRVGRRFVKLGLYDNLQEYVDELETIREI